MFYNSISNIVAWPNIKDSKTSFTHIINPFKDTKTSKHETIQSLTFHGIAKAKKLTESTKVDVLCAVYPEDKSIVQNDFLCKDFLCKEILLRSVSDEYSFNYPKKLPFIFDILNAGSDDEYDKQDNNYVIYTNIDIIPLPFFYETISNLVNKGIDSIIINRRTVSKDWCSQNFNPLIFSEIGRKHGGFDCFIFKRSLLKNFVRSDACIGAGGVMMSLLFNLVALSDKIAIIPDAHLTCHVGDDRLWAHPKFKDYTYHNKLEAQKVAKQLAESSALCKKRLAAFAVESDNQLLLDLLGMKNYKGKIKKKMRKAVKNIVDDYLRS